MPIEEVRVLALEAQVMELTQSVSVLTATLISLRNAFLNEPQPPLMLYFNNRLVPVVSGNMGDFRALSCSNFGAWFPRTPAPPMTVSTPDPPQRIRPLAETGSVWDRLAASELKEP